jgi:hypothetical protein
MGKSRAHRRKHEETDELDAFVAEPAPVASHDRIRSWTLPGSLLVIWTACALGLFIGVRLDVMLAYGLAMSAVLIVIHVMG